MARAEQIARIGFAQQVAAPARLGRVGVHARHQQGRDRVELLLLLRKALDVDVDVPAEDQLQLPADDHGLPAHVAAVPLVKFELPRPEVLRADGRERRAVLLSAQDVAPVQVRRLVLGDDLAQRAVGRVQRILLAEVRLPAPLRRKVLIAAPAHVHGVKQGEQARVVDVRMGDPRALAPARKVRDARLQQGEHLLAVAGEAAVHKEQLLPVLQYVGIAAAGRVDDEQAQPRRQILAVDAGVEALPLPVPDKPGEAADVVKGLQGRLLLLVQDLHQLVRIDEHLVGLLLRKVQDRAHGVGKGDVEDRAVEQAVRHLVVEDADLADAGDLLDQALDLARVLDEQAHLEVLIRRSVFLGADVGDVHAVAAQGLQHGQDRAGFVLEGHDDHEDLRLRIPLGEVPARRELPGDPRVLGLGRGDLEEERVQVHRLVVVDAHDVSARGGDDPAGQQKGAGLVRHPGDVGIAHETCPFASFFRSGKKKAAPGDSSPGAAHFASLRRCGIRR